MKEGMLYLYCRAREGMRDFLRRTYERLALREIVAGEAGLSSLATVVILLGVAVALTLAVVYVIGPAIQRLAERTGSQIDSAPMDWGQ